MEGHAPAQRLREDGRSPSDEPDPEPLELRLPAVAASIREARRAVSVYARPLVADPDAVALAVSEIVTNAVLHAYPAGDPGSVWITAGLDGDHLVVTVVDHGSGMRPNPDADRIGIGLPLVGRLALGLALAERPSGGTQLKMHFRRASAQ